MRKTLIAVLAGAMAFATVPAAFAKDHSITGFWRVRGMVNNYGAFGGGGFADNADPGREIDQRFRAKYTLGLNEYVSVTYYGEVDIQYGDASYATSRNQGGAIGGDTVNLETKNLYLDVKIPETPVSARLGLQGFADHWDWTVILADMAGFTFRAKLEMADVMAGYFKLQEGDANGLIGNNTEDDIDLWAVQVGVKPPMDGLKLGLDGLYLNDNDFDGTGNKNLYWVGAHAGYKVAGVDLSGWFAYNFGEASSTSDVNAWMVNGKAAYSVAGAGVSLRLFYTPGDDDSDADQEWFHPVKATETFAMATDGLMIFTPDITWTTLGQYGHAFTDGVYAGNGAWGAILSGSFTPPAVQAAYVKGAAGYFSTTDGKDNGAQDDDLGFEVAGRVGYKLADAVDLSLNGAYAWLGDFYAGTGGGGKDPDDAYTAYFMVNVGF
ncbi:MAG: membrane protein [Deferrisomatales bacterium]